MTLSVILLVVAIPVNLTMTVAVSLTHSAVKMYIKEGILIKDI